MRPAARIVILSLSALWWFGLSTPASTQGRIAFVVGNDRYESVSSLQKAVNDARSVAQSLQKLGFEVVLTENATRRTFNSRFSAFENRIRSGDTVFLFFAGHGVELDGANYLIPVDAPKPTGSQQSELKDESISTDGLIQRMKARGARTQIVVLDACRENPFSDNRGRSIGGRRGLAPIQLPSDSGVFVIYSAGVGEVALDRLGDKDADPNSVFTRSFLPLIEDPSRSLVTVAKETRARVKALAGTIGQTQSPAYYDEVDGEIFLARAVLTTATAQPVMPRPAIQQPGVQSPPPSLAALPPPPTESRNTSGFLFPDSDRRYLRRDELAGLSVSQLRIARNEIFARRGRHFRDQALVAHFSRLSWYKPSHWNDSLASLNAFERANVTLIQSLER